MGEIVQEARGASVGGALSLVFKGITLVEYRDLG